MYNESKEINWEEIFNLYNTIKWLYALCEETDTELNTICNRLMNLELH